MRTPDYDYCYRVLGLEPGAALEAIEEEWKLLAAAYHPDKFTGRLQDKALRRLQEINNARDQLKQYWSANGTAPPRSSRVNPGAGTPRSSGQSARSAGTPPRAHAGASPRPEAGAPGSTAGSTASGATGASAQNHAGANRRQETEFNSLVPFGPPALKKTPLEHLFELLDKLESEGKSDLAAALAASLMVVAACVPLILFHNVAIRVFQISPEFLYGGAGGLFNSVLWCAAGFVVVKNSSAAYQLYKIKQNPTIETVSHNTDAVIQRIKASLAQAQVNGADWQVAEPETLDDGTIKVGAEVKFKAKAFYYFDADYDVSLQVRLLPSSTRRRSMVCYWFTPGKDGFWLPPMAATVKATDDVLNTGIRI